MRISVVVCTFNGSKFISEQLESILKQSIPISELVIGDDGSTDDTNEIISGWINANKPKFPEIEFHYKINPKQVGVAKNFEAAMLRANGDWVFLCDQDDIWFPNKIETFVNFIKSNSGIHVFNSDGLLVSENLNKLPFTLFESLGVTERDKSKFLRNKAFQVLIRKNICSGSAMAVNKAVIRLALPVPDRWLHDEWIALVSSILFSNLIIDEPTYLYRQHSGNEIGARKPSFRNKLSKFREPREERNINIYLRSKSLYEFAVERGWGDLSPIPGLIKTLEQNKKFHEKRLLLPPTNALRIFQVIYMLIRGQYKRFANGFQDAIRDIAQPAPFGKLSQESRFQR